MTEDNFEDRYPKRMKADIDESATADSSVVHHDKQDWDDPRPVEEIYITDLAAQHPDEVDEDLLPEPEPQVVYVKLGKLHAIFWLLIVISGMVWSFMLATYLFTGFGSQAVSLMGVLGTLVLSLTVFMLSKDNVAPVTKKSITEDARGSDQK